MKLPVVVLMLFAVLTTFAQQDTMSSPRRQAHQLSLPVADKVQYKYDVPAGLFVRNNDTLQLFPGEKVFLEVNHNGREIKGVKAVQQISEPLRTLTISFRQVADSTTHKNMLLTIDNPFDKQLQCTMLLGVILAKRWERGGALNIPPGKTAQAWPQILISLSLQDWAFTK